MRSILVYERSLFDWLASSHSGTTPATTRRKRSTPTPTSNIRIVFAIIIIIWYLQFVSSQVAVFATTTSKITPTAVPFIKYGLRHHRRRLHLRTTTTSLAAFATHSRRPKSGSTIPPTTLAFFASQFKFRSTGSAQQCCYSSTIHGGPYRYDFHRRRRRRLRSSSRLAMATTNHDNNQATTGSNGVGKLQIYPMECYDDLIQEKKRQKLHPQGRDDQDDGNSNNSISIRTIQRVHIIRHAEGTHNVNMEYKLPINRDAPLTTKGKQQCYELAKVTADIFPSHRPPYLIITSTMTRCIQTTLLSLPHLIPSVVEVDDDNEQGSKQQQQYASASSNSNVSSLSNSSTTASRSSNTSRSSRIIAHEGIRETVNYECDVRRSIIELQTEFPMIDFSYALPDVIVEEILHIDENDDDDNDNDARKKKSTTTSKSTTKTTTYHDPIWHGYRQRLGHDHDAHCESAELHVVAKRGREFFEWLVRQQQEREQQDRDNRDNDHDDTHDDDDNDEHDHDNVVIICTHSAFLRCILNWSQVGGVPKQMPQVLDTRSDEEKSPHCPNMRPLFEYCYYHNPKKNKDENEGSHKEKHVEFETIMRSDYDNCELRSFCLVQRG